METASQLGIGGIFAMLVIREVLTFVSSVIAKRKNGNGKNGNGTAGERSAEFWQTEQRKAVTDIVGATVVPILNNQTIILHELRVATTDMNKSVAIMLDRLARHDQ